MGQPDSSAVPCATTPSTFAHSTYKMTSTGVGQSHGCSYLFYKVCIGVGLVLGAFCGGTLVGVCAMARPGLCQPTALEKLSVVPWVLFGNPISTIPRVLTWTREWSRRDLLEPHWHLGPVAVESHLQGQGNGTAIIDDF